MNYLHKESKSADIHAFKRLICKISPRFNLVLSAPSDSPKHGSVFKSKSYDVKTVLSAVVSR